MTASGMQRSSGKDMAARVIYFLGQIGLPALPRNYELIYEAFNGSRPDLAREVSELTPPITQDELDAVGRKYLAHHFGGSVVDHVQGRVTDELHRLLRLLRQEHASLESYTRVLGETYARINAKSASSVDLLQNAVSILSEATGNTMEQGKVIARSVEERSGEMERVRQELDEYKKIANTDALTRLANRRAFDEVMSQIYADAETGKLYAIVLVDIDHFKRLNDTYGHPIGDRVLGIVGSVIRASLRSDAFVARTGGEEFAIILRGLSTADAIEIAERVRRAIEATPLRNQKTGTQYGPITVSAGVCMGDQANTAEELYQHVDLALYAAKARGRNRVEAYDPALEEMSLSGKLIYRRGVA